MSSVWFRGVQVILLGFVSLTVCGCASGPNKADPWEKTNRFIYNVNDGIDRVALKPAADVYVKVVPSPIRSGIGNGFANLVYFNVVVNDFLQGKGGQGWGDAGRMAVNSTIGIGGIFDVASGWGLPAHENDFGVTLGKWGSTPGPYLVLPLLGPSTARDVPGLGVEYAATPITWLWLPWKITVPLFATRTVDLRSSEDDVARFRSTAAIDAYVFTRDAYMQYRDALIRDGKPPATQSIYDEDDPEPTTRAAGGK